MAFAQEFCKRGQGGYQMESLILASYVLKTKQTNPEKHPAFDEAAQRSARVALSSIAASMVGMAAYIFVLTLFG